MLPLKFRLRRNHYSESFAELKPSYGRVEITLPVSDCWRVSMSVSVDGHYKRAQYNVENSPHLIHKTKHRKHYCRILGGPSFPL